MRSEVWNVHTHNGKYEIMIPKILLSSVKLMFPVRPHLEDHTLVPRQSLSMPQNWPHPSPATEFMKDEQYAPQIGGVMVAKFDALGEGKIGRGSMLHFVSNTDLEIILKGEIQGVLNKASEKGSQKYLKKHKYAEFMLIQFPKPSCWKICFHRWIQFVDKCF